MALCVNCGGTLKDGAKFCGLCGAGASPDGVPMPPVSYNAPPPQRGPTLRAPLPVNQSTHAFSHAPPDGSGGGLSYVEKNESGDALDNLLASWNGLYWWIRLAVVGATLCLAGLALMSAVGVNFNGPGGFLFLLAGAPVLMSLAVYLSRPEPVLGWMDRFVRWSARKKARAADKGTFVSRWFFRPVYGAFCGSAGLTASIGDPYLRVAVTLALQILALYAAIFAAYVAIGLVLAIVILVVMIWIIGAIMSGSSGGGSSRVLSSRSLPARSERRRDIWGNDYVQHFDGDGRKVGYSRTQRDIWGNQYEQHNSQDNRKLGHSEQKEDWLGQSYTQHYDRDGSKSGWSENGEGLLGNEYVQHYDRDGRKAGRSEVREDLFGNRYIKSEDE